MRAIAIACLLLAAGCTLVPDASPYKPKTAADCPGQKACGYKCVGFDDPSAGCQASGCDPCPAGPVGTAPACVVGNACGFACLPGYSPSGGNVLAGCVVATGSSTNCGSLGHPCAAGLACAGGACVSVVTEVNAIGAVARGLAVVSVAGTNTFFWANDPPVSGGSIGAGQLHRVQPPAAATNALPSTTDLPLGIGHPTFVRAISSTNVAVAGNDSSDGLAWYLDASVSPATSILGYGSAGGSAGTIISGLVVTPGWVIASEAAPGGGACPACILDVEAADGRSSGGVIDYGEPLDGLGLGAGYAWVGGTGGVYRVTDLNDPAVYPSSVPGGGVYFSMLATAPRPQRIGAIAGTNAIQVYFADLTDGSVWTGLTLGTPGAGPWKLWGGTTPAAQMDLVSDDAGVVFSHYDRGEIWAVSPTNQLQLLASGVKPWALAITPTRVYWTDVTAQAIRSLPR